MLEDIGAQGSKLKVEGSKLKAEKLKDKSTKLDIENMKFKAESQKRVKDERQIKSFGFENLEVWDRSVDFAVRVIDLVESLDTARKHFRRLEQIEASCSSISMNLAEGKGRYSKKEFVQFCYIARGSLYETMTLLEIFKRKEWVTEEDFSTIKLKVCKLRQ